MILPGQQIEFLSINGKDLIAPFDAKNLRASSYDLTVGEEYYIGCGGKSSTLSTQPLKNSQTFTIPPHAVCFVLAAETIHLPDDITAKVSLRMPHIYSGMILSSQPPFDPHYKGRVIVMLHNLSSAPFNLKQGTRLATIEFMRVEQKTIVPTVQRAVNNIQEQLPGPLVSSLVEIANLSSKTNNKVTWLSGQVVLFVTLVVAVLAVPGFVSYSSINDKLTSMQDKLIDQKEKLQEMSQSIEAYRIQLKRKSEEIETIRSQFDTLTTKIKVRKLDTPTAHKVEAPESFR